MRPPENHSSNAFVIESDWLTPSGESQSTISQKLQVLRPKFREVKLIRYTETGTLKFAGVKEFKAGLRYSHRVIYCRSD